MSKELHELLTEMVKLYQERQCFLAVHAERLCALLPAAPAAPAPVPLRLGRELFKFDTFPGWVNHAQRAWKAEGVRPEVTICIDAKGRPCRIGRDFMKARDEGAFPVRVYLLRAEDDPAAHGIGKGGAA